MTKRRVVAAAAAGSAALAAAIVAVAVAAGDAEPSDGAAAPQSPVVVVERRDLSTREQLDGRLGYDDTRTVLTPAAGTLTSLPDAGAIVRPGETLYTLDGKPAILLDGRTPAWRDLAEGIADGLDVHRLERNLVALGYDPLAHVRVDRRFDLATRAAVQRLQRAFGLPPTGTLELGRVVFLRGPRRVGTLEAAVGSPVQAGAELLETTATRRVVTIDLDARKQAIVAVGRPVRIVLPDRTTVSGTIAEVGRVATKASSEKDAVRTIEVVVDVRGGTGTLDQAPVKVDVTVTARKDVLAVPVRALLAVERGFALEVVRGATTAVVPVRVGVFGDGWVEVSGAGVREGTRVVEASR